MFFGGQIFGAFSNSITLLLSSNTLQLTLGRFVSMFNGFYNCSRCYIIGMISLIDCDSAIYSASVVDKDILDCNLDDHSIGQFLYLMIYPVQEYTEAGLPDSFVDHPPVKSASTKHSSPLSFFGYIISPFYFVPFRYLVILFTPLLCEDFGLAENLAVEYVVYAMSGLDEPEI